MKSKFFMCFCLLLIAFNLYSQQRREIKTYLDWDKTKIDEWYFIDLKTNQKDGPYKSYNKFAVLITEGNYTQGNQSGKWTTREFNGEFINSITYDSKGVKNGPAEGKVTNNNYEKGNYVNGYKEGNWKTYGTNNKNQTMVAFDLNYKKGEVDGLCKYYQGNGSLSSIGTMRSTGVKWANSVKEGKWTFYVDNYINRIASYEYYKNDIGIRAIYYTYDGDKLVKIEDKNEDKNTGTELSLGADGTIQAIHTYELIGINYKSKGRIIDLNGHSETLFDTTGTYSKYTLYDSVSHNIKSVVYDEWTDNGYKKVPEADLDKMKTIKFVDLKDIIGTSQYISLLPQKVIAIGK